MTIIDAHTHMPSQGKPEHNGLCATAEDAVARLRRVGARAALFNTWQGVLSETENDLDEGNREALDLAKKFDGFLYPGAVIHPAFPEKSRRWLDKFRDLGRLWVGELVAYRCGAEFDAPSWMTLFEYCAKHGHAVQLHNSEAVIRVALAFPETRVICSHLNLPNQDETMRNAWLDALAARPNIWLDVSGRCGGFTPGAIGAALKSFGPDRLLFGTDFTGYEPEAFIARVKSEIENPEIQEKVYSQNILRLLKEIGGETIKET